MKANAVNDKIKEVQICSGYNLGHKLFKYQNSKVVKAMLQHISELNNEDPWAKGLAQGFEDARSKKPNEINRINELDIIFKKQAKEKENELEQER